MLVALAALGCNQYQVTRFQGDDVFAQNRASEVDILLVVDSSCSMAPYQQRLGRNFQAFISYFVGANVDYHIAVTTTDVITDKGRLHGSVLTPTTPDPETTFADIVNVGTSGSGYEMGLQGGDDALNRPDNVGFLRDEASLSLIYVSDEEDSSPNPVDDYVNALFLVKGGGRQRELVNASALTVTDVSTCSAVEQQHSSAGTRYLDVVAQTNGVAGNLCADDVDFSTIVTNLSLDASRLTDRFFLSHAPDPTSLVVHVGQGVVPCTAGWHYDVLPDAEKDTPAVVFDDDALPAAGQQVEVTYAFGTGDPAGFSCSS